MTTYIKRVPQFKAVQYKMEDKVLAELFELIPNLTTWKIDDSGLTLTHTVIKLGEDTREETLRLRDGDFNDWLVRSEKGDLSVLSNNDFKAQYEAAPEVKRNVSLDELRRGLMPDSEVARMTGETNARLLEVSSPNFELRRWDISVEGEKFELQVTIDKRLKKPAMAVMVSK